MWSFFVCGAQLCAFFLSPLPARFFFFGAAAAHTTCARARALFCSLLVCCVSLELRGID